MLQSLKKFARADTEILTFVSLEQNWNRIIHLPQKGFFLKFHLVDFYLPITPYHTAEILKSFLGRYTDTPTTINVST